MGILLMGGLRVKSEACAYVTGGPGWGWQVAWEGHALLGSCDSSFWARGKQSKSPWGCCHLPVLRPGCWGWGWGRQQRVGHVTHELMTNKQV